MCVKLLSLTSCTLSHLPHQLDALRPKINIFSTFHIYFNFWPNIYQHLESFQLFINISIPGLIVIFTITIRMTWQQTVMPITNVTNRNGKAKTLKSQGLCSAKEAVDSLNLIIKLIWGSSYLWGSLIDDANLFYGECEMAKSAVAEVETSCGGVETAIK